MAETRVEAATGVTPVIRSGLAPCKLPRISSASQTDPFANVAGLTSFVIASLGIREAQVGAWNFFLVVLLFTTDNL